MENINIDFSEKEFQKIKANKHNYEKIGNETLYDKDNLIKILLKISAVVFLFIYIFYLFPIYFVKKKRVGFVCVENCSNPGNNLVKYAMYTKLKEYGFEPILIARNKSNKKIDFLLRTIQLKNMRDNFTDLKREDYDILMVNSDLCWTYSIKAHFYDNAFLKFARNWNVPKFVYAASMGL